MLIFSLIVLFIIVLLSLYWLFMSSFSQVFGRYPYRAKTDKKLIALTFDDGPNEQYTSDILKILEKYSIKATFFLVGKAILREPGLTKKIYNSGHTIGNHSLSHEFHKYFSSLTFKKEILNNQEIIKKQIGQKPALFRSPWLWRQPFLLSTLKKYGLQPISGEFCHPLEVLQIDSDKIAAHVLKIVRSGSIIIFHDGKDGKTGNRRETVKAVETVISSLNAQGYEFITVDKLLNIPAYQ
jgi:peptidoglycan/xylan/chitin deacetylase (PgdA/CDA1 family)